jgi:hypothetical protein
MLLDQRAASEPTTRRNLPVGNALHLQHLPMGRRMENRNTPPQANPPARETRPPREDPSAGVDEDMDDLVKEAVEGNEANLEPGDVGFDRVVGAEEAGLGDGLDQAEEAQLGVTDEELAELTRHLRTPKQ